MEYNWTHLKKDNIDIDNFIQYCQSKTHAMNVKVFDKKDLHIFTYEVPSCFQLKEYIETVWHNNKFINTYKMLLFDDQVMIIIYNNDQLIERHIGTFQN